MELFDLCLGEEKIILVLMMTAVWIVKSQRFPIGEDERICDANGINAVELLQDLVQALEPSSRAQNPVDVESFRVWSMQ